MVSAESRAQQLLGVFKCGVGCGSQHGNMAAPKTRTVSSPAAHAGTGRNCASAESGMAAQTAACSFGTAATNRNDVETARISTNMATKNAVRRTAFNRGGANSRAARPKRSAAAQHRKHQCEGDQPVNPLLNERFLGERASVSVRQYGHAMPQHRNRSGNGERKDDDNTGPDAFHHRSWMEVEYRA